MAVIPCFCRWGRACIQSLLSRKHARLSALLLQCQVMLTLPGANMVYPLMAPHFRTDIVLLIR